MSWTRGVCVWCRGDARGAPPEYSVPESLGCAPEWVLTEGACATCNHGVLAKLDRVLADSFDLFRVQAGIVGRKGRRASINGRGNMKGTTTAPGHVTLAVNMTREAAVAPVLGRLSGHQDRPTDVRATMTGTGEPGSPAAMNLKIEFDGRDLARAIHKVALELVATSTGLDVMNPALDPVRDFVVRDRGRRYLLAGCKPDGYRHQMRRLWEGQVQGECVIELALCGVEFLVDLMPGQPVVRHWREEPTILTGVGVLPSSVRDAAGVEGP